LEVLLGEAEAESFATGIANDTKRLVSTISDLEVPIVIEARKDPASRHELDRLLHPMGAAMVAFNQPNARSHAMGGGGGWEKESPGKTELGRLLLLRAGQDRRCQEPSHI